MLWDMSSKQGGCPQFDISVSAVLPDDKKTGLWNSCVTSRGGGGVEEGMVLWKLLVDQVSV